MWYERTSPLDPSSPKRIGWENGREILEREKEEDIKEGILEREAPTCL